MTKNVISPFGEPLNEDAKKLIKEIRLKINQPIHPNFDTDFNIYRFALAAEKVYKKDKEIISHASKALNNHLRIRKALNLDAEKILNFDENPIFQKKLMPRGDISDKCDGHNRLLWYIEYATITVESIAHSIQSSQACKYQFWQFEYMLRRVMEQEEKSGKLSSLRHIIDMNGYEINPFTMLFVTSGTLAYYSQLFHYENYPELVTPVDMVNIAKWIHVPYKLAKSMMPAGFADKFRLHDNQYLKNLTEDIPLEYIPTSLGGTDNTYKCIGAEKVEPKDYWTPSNTELVNALETFHVPARKTRHITLNLQTAKTLSWYFRTDGDIYFGIFYEDEEEFKSRKESELNIDALEMVYPWLKLSAKLVHEMDTLKCERVGRYHIVFCNKHSWISRRNVDFFAQKETLSDCILMKLCHPHPFEALNSKRNETSGRERMATSTKHLDCSYRPPFASSSSVASSYGLIDNYLSNLHSPSLFTTDNK
ncbi:unnamed protein product [Caenorhabditis auriculariae]|uniref:CRAL-TRIO domain-containing protein n=1 Tax=Caenorhabditis auriculariae TaxID=2777116 RepID=A0A8S1GWA7_9PELO|nr:unnamed protein product [Caenorhabditis auriculariae]